MRRETSRVSFLMCPFRVRGLLSVLETENGTMECSAELRRFAGLRRARVGATWVGETPAAWMTPVTSRNFVAFSTSAYTDSREETSTVAVLTSKPASRITSSAASTFSRWRSASTTLPGADAPGDRLTDRSCADNDHDLAPGPSRARRRPHVELLTWGYGDGSDSRVPLVTASCGCVRGGVGGRGC